MEITVNLNGQKRKALAVVVGEILGATPQYKGPPTYNYEVGQVVISRDAKVVMETRGAKNPAIVKKLMAGLSQRGFEPYVEGDTAQAEKKLNYESADGPADEAPPVLSVETAQETSSEEPRKALTRSMSEATLESMANQTPEPAIETEPPAALTIQMPLAGFDAVSLQNLWLLVQSKATLIKKALEIDDLSVEITDDTVDFPWFTTMPSSQELTAYTHLITGMCEMAKRQKRIIAVEKPTDNDKFTFRLFLVRLGLIGDEYSDTRRILLRNLSGNGSWKDGDSRNRAKTAGQAVPQAMVQAAEQALIQDNRRIAAQYGPQTPVWAGQQTSPETMPQTEQEIGRGVIPDLTSPATETGELMTPTIGESQETKKPRFSWKNWFKNSKMMGY
jgi:hypothetical protein